MRQLYIQYATEMAECNKIANDLVGQQDMKKKLKDTDGAIERFVGNRLDTDYIRDLQKSHHASSGINSEKYNIMVNYFKFTLDQKESNGLLDYNIKTEDHGSEDHDMEGTVSASANIRASNNLADQMFGGLDMLWGNVSHPEADAIRKQMNKAYYANKSFKSLIHQNMARMNEQGVFHDLLEFKHQPISYDSQPSLEQKCSMIAINLGLVPQGFKGFSKVRGGEHHESAWEEYPEGDERRFGMGQGKIADGLDEGDGGEQSVPAAHNKKRARTAE